MASRNTTKAEFYELADSKMPNPDIHLDTLSRKAMKLRFLGVDF